MSAGIVLRSPREDLDDPLDLGVATDDGIKFALASKLGKIAAVGVERRRFALAFARALYLCFRSEQRGSLDAYLRRIDAQVREDAGSDAFAFANEAEQQVLGADVVMVELTRLFESEFDDALGSRGEHHLLLDGLPASTDDRFNFGANLRQVDS